MRGKEWRRRNVDSRGWLIYEPSQSDKVYPTIIANLGGNSRERGEGLEGRVLAFETESMQITLAKTGPPQCDPEQSRQTYPRSSC